jgi:hypothetical protein
MTKIEAATTYSKIRRGLWTLAAAGALALGGCGAAENPGTQTASVAEQKDLMTRWNEVADGITTSDGFNFHWEPFDQFPHPTYRLGTAEAYGLFAKILVSFYEKNDNFDYLTSHHLFRARIYDVFPSGQVGVDTNFEQLTNLLVDSAWTSIDTDTHQKLVDFAAKIKTSP